MRRSVLLLLIIASACTSRNEPSFIEGAKKIHDYTEARGDFYFVDSSDYFDVKVINVGVNRDGGDDNLVVDYVSFIQEGPRVSEFKTPNDLFVDQLLFGPRTICKAQHFSDHLPDGNLDLYRTYDKAGSCFTAEERARGEKAGVKEIDLHKRYDPYYYPIEENDLYCSREGDYKYCRMRAMREGEMSPSPGEIEEFASGQKDYKHVLGIISKHLKSKKEGP